MLRRPISLQQMSSALTTRRKIILSLLMAIVYAIPISTGLPPVLIGPVERHKISYGILPTISAANTPDMEHSQRPLQIEDSQSLSKEQSLEAYGQLPLAFEANQGQSDEHVRFISRGSGYGLFLTSTEAVLTLRPPATQSKKTEDRAAIATASSSTRDDVLRLKFVGANLEPQMTGMEELPGKVNYFIGNDRTKWRTDISTYARVKYQDVYPGVDLVYYGNQRKLEYDLIVAPEADPTNIALRVEGSKALVLDAKGSLVLKMAGGTIMMKKPYVYQEINGTRQAVQSRYMLKDAHQVGFQIGCYDTSKPLVIDPVVLYSTYLGGSAADQGKSIAVDSTGNAYVTGSTASINFPAVNPYHFSLSGSDDVFIAKLNTTGSTLIYSTYLGGTLNDSGYGIAVDSTGNAYVTGQTYSNNFPTFNPYQSTYGGITDGFVAKLNVTGNALLYSTYLGGNAADYGYGIAVDSTGNACVTGQSSSINLSTASAYQPIFSGLGDAYVAKFNATGSALLYFTFLGGSASDAGYGIALDSAGNAYVTGTTYSTNFPTLSPYQSALGGMNDAFVAKLNATGSALLYSTYLGGNASDQSDGIAVDSAGSAYVTGATTSTNFPTANAYQSNQSGAGDAFVTKLNATGNGLLYSTYLGGSALDAGYAIAVDSAGNAYITGPTSSANFPTMSATQPIYGGGSDAFVTKLNAVGNGLLYSTYLGGSVWEQGYGITVDSAGNAYITGITSSTNFSTVNPYQPTFGGAYDAFVVKFGPAPTLGTPSPCVAPPNTTMVAWYPFDETTGITAANLATGNTGILMNSPTHIPGKVGWALRFDGIDDYVDSPSTIVTNIGPAGLPQTCGGAYSTCRGDFSIDAWLYVDPTANLGSITIVDKRSSTATTTTGYYFYVYQRNTLGLVMADGMGGAAYYSPVITGLAGSWHHIAVTVSRRAPSGIKWYDNGVNIGFSDPTAAGLSVYGSLANNSPLRIGSRTTATALQGWFKGSIDELEIFNRELTQAEVNDIFTAGAAGKCK